jgi:glycosyltransferase involved in cell wall biosynthesis
MARADLLLLPTRYEGMPNVVLEAMAHGLPIAVTRVEGVAHALGDGLASQSADRGDWAGWARLVVQLARDESQRKGIASANRARAMSEFSLPQMLSRYERLYQELLES